MIDQGSSQLFLEVFIDWPKKLFDAVHRNVAFVQINELLLILAGHGSNDGHRPFFPVVAHRLSSCAERMSADLHPNLVEGRKE